METSPIDIGLFTSSESDVAFAFIKLGYIAILPKRKWLGVNKPLVVLVVVVVVVVVLFLENVVGIDLVPF